jgi:O-antigen ligase
MVDAAASSSRSGRLTSTAALWSIVLLVFLMPFENVGAIAGVGSLTRLVGIAALAITVLSLVEGGRVHLRAPSLFLIMAIAYLAWSMSSYFWSIDPTRSFGRVTALAQLLSLVWVIHQVATNERRRNLLAQSLVLGSYVGIFLALVARIGTDGSYRDIGGGNPNWFAIGCAFVIPVAWSLALRAKHRGLFWINAVYPAFALLAVVLAASRGGLITALVALVVIPLTLPRLSWIRRMLLASVLPLAGLGAVTLAPQTFIDLQANIERLESTTVEISEGTLTGRTRIWQSGVDAFWESPIVGHGAGTFSRTVAASLGQARGAHNGFLSVLVSVGLVGLVAYVAMIFVVIAGIMIVRERRVELLILIATLVVGLTPANMEHNKVVWLILGLASVSRPILIVAGARSGTSARGVVAAPLTENH